VNQRKRQTPMAPRTEGAILPAMRELLRRAGFGIRSATRADCAYCTGRSRGTAAFTDTLAFCHRCHWKANRIGLARQLGLLAADPDTERKLRRETRHRQAIESTLASFERWREAQLRETTSRYRVLGRQAALACQVLSHWQECNPAWNALARLYHDEAKLCAVLDWLTFTKASIWLHRDSRPTEVFAAWRATHAAA
jgi:hypothetical protein